MDWLEQPAGQRFKYRYQQDKSHPIKRVGNILLGIVLLAAGLVLVPLPGPGWVIVFIGLGFLSGEVQVIAKFLDWVDWKIASPVVERWKSHRLLYTGMLGLIGALCLCLAWLYGPEFELGPLRWGNR